MSRDKPVILCIDDDSDILDYLRVVLEAEGYAVATADSAEEGLRACDETSPDLIIVDLMMEEVDAGAVLARELRLRGNRVPVFLLSSVGDNLNLTTDYTSLGLAGVFQKPLSRQHLLSVLKTKLAHVG